MSLNTTIFSTLSCPNYLYQYCFSNTNFCDYFEPYMKPIKIRLKNNLYTIPPKGYMLNNTSYNGFSHKCMIMLGHLSDSQGIYVLGDTFLRAFYTTFDLTNSQIILSVNRNAAIGTLVSTETSSWLYFAYFTSVVAGLTLCCIAFCFTRRCIQRKRNASLLKDFDDNDSITDVKDRSRSKLQIGTESILLK